MEDHARALGVAEKARAETRALMRALDQAGQVGDDEIGALKAHHAELWIEGGERIVRDLRLCRRATNEEGGFARIGQTDQADIGDPLESEPVGLLLGRLSGIGMAPGLVRPAFELLLPAGALTAHPVPA